MTSLAMKIASGFCFRAATLRASSHPLVNSSGIETTPDSSMRKPASFNALR
jgi:hypothetical protein